jgi:hypothetical protein
MEKFPSPFDFNYSLPLDKQMDKLYYYDNPSPLGGDKG